MSIPKQKKVKLSDATSKSIEVDIVLSTLYCNRFIAEEILFPKAKKWFEIDQLSDEFVSHQLATDKDHESYRYYNKDWELRLFEKYNNGKSETHLVISGDGNRNTTHQLANVIHGLFKDFLKAVGDRDNDGRNPDFEKFGMDFFTATTKWTYRDVDIFDSTKITYPEFLQTDKMQFTAGYKGFNEKLSRTGSTIQITRTPHIELDNTINVSDVTVSSFGKLIFVNTPICEILYDAFDNNQMIAEHLVSDKD